MWISPWSLATSSIRQGKRKATAIDLTDESNRNSKPRTLGGDRPREVGVVKEIGGGMVRPIIAPMTLGGDVIPLPPIVTYLSVECGEDLFEGRNSENLGTSLAIFLRTLLRLLVKQNTELWQQNQQR
jgi:protein HIRA/HIR1